MKLQTRANPPHLTFLKLYVNSRFWNLIYPGNFFNVLIQPCSIHQNWGDVGGESITETGSWELLTVMGRRQMLKKKKKKTNAGKIKWVTLGMSGHAKAETSEAKVGTARNKGSWEGWGTIGNQDEMKPREVSHSQPEQTCLLRAYSSPASWLDSAVYSPILCCFLYRKFWPWRAINAPDVASHRFQGTASAHSRQLTRRWLEEICDQAMHLKLTPGQYPISKRVI